jgi:fumarate reductase subunit C
MKNYRTEIRWALIFVAMSLLWMLLERIAGLHSTYISKHPVYTNFIAVPAIAVYVLALLEKRKKAYQGFMNYQQGFVTGLIITGIVTLLSPLTQVITSIVITPHFFDNAIAYAVSTGKLSQEKAEAYFSLSNYIIQGLIGAPVMGIITSAIVALFTMKKNRGSNQ